MPSRYVIEEDPYDIDAYHDRVYEEMAMRARFESARPVVAMRGGPVAEEDGGDGGADEEEEEEYEEEEEEREGVQLVAGDCEPPPRARVSGVAAAAGAGAAVETANTSTCPVCMDPWTSQGPHRIRWVTNASFALRSFVVCTHCGDISSRTNV
jgi:E3 ubiquitin-protein ligase RFWD3